MITSFKCECGWKSALCEHAGEAFEKTKQEIATLKAELETRNNHYEVQVGLAKMYQKQRDEAREAIDLLKVQLESYRTSANHWEMNWAQLRAELTEEKANREGEKQEMREVIDRLKAELETRNNHYEVQVGLAKMYQKQRDDERAENAKLKETARELAEYAIKVGTVKIQGSGMTQELPTPLAHLGHKVKQALLSGNGQQAGEDGETK